MAGSRPKNRIKKNKARKPRKRLTVETNRCPKPHRFVITDKKTNMQFLVAPDAEVSLFPKFIVSERPQGVDQSYVLVNNSGAIIHTFGHITQEIDFGLGKSFSWQFALVNLQKPVIGSDFLSHYRLKFNFEKMCLENPETGLQTASIPTVACECHRNEFCHDGWPSTTAIFKRSLKHRNHVTDKDSKIPFLIDCDAEISVFPKSKLNGDTLELFDGSFELHGRGDDITQVLGWTNRKLNFGTGREFTWKFAVVNFEMPIIGLDFLHKFGLDLQLKFGYLRLLDRQTNRSTSTPTGPCECGNRRSGWPISTALKKSSISKTENQQRVTSNHKGNFGSIHMKTQTSSRNSVSLRQNSKTFDQHPGPSRQNYQNPRNHKNYMISNQSTRNYQNSRFLHNYRPFRRFYKTRKPETTKEVGFKSRKAREENDKSAEGTNFSKKDESGVNHRLHVDDKNSNLPFLIGFAAEISVFPKSELKEEEDLEPFDGSFELKGPNREVVPILGWAIRTLDIGLTRNFTWKFAVLDIDKPILGLDFILHYGLIVGTQGLVDPTTNLATPPPSGLCDCGKPYDGWPGMSYSKKKPVSDKFKSKIQKDETGSTEKEIGTLNEESRKDSPTPEKDSDDFGGSREPHKESSPAKDAGPAEKATSSKEKIKTLNKESRNDSPTPEKDSDGFRGSREPDKDSLPAENEELEKKTDSSKEEIESLIEESRKYSPTTEKDSDDFGGSREPDKESSPTKDAGPAEKATSLKEKIETLNEESRDDSPTPEKDFDGFRGSREPDKDSSPAENEELEKKTDSLKEEIESLIEESGKYSPTTEKDSNDLRGSVEPNKDSSSTKGEGPEKKTDSSKEEIESLTEESRKDSPTHEKDSDDFKESREPDKDSLPAKDEGHVEKIHSSKEDIETLSEESRKYSPTSKKDYDDLRGSRESNKDSSSTKGEGPEKKTDSSKEEIGSLNKESRKDSPTPEKDSDDFEEYIEPDKDSSSAKDEGLAKKIHSSTEDIETLSEESRKYSPTSEKDSDDFGGSREPHKESSPAKDAGPAEKATSSKEKIETLNKESRDDSPTPEKDSDDFEESIEPDKDSSSAKDEGLAKKIHSSTEEIVDVLHRFHIDDRNSNLPFFIGTEAEVSVFPKSEVEVENLEPFNGSFKLKGAFEDLAILGWTIRTLDIGLTREFTWKFAVIDICKPIIGNDFIRHYGFAIENQSLIDPETKLVTPPPSGPCDCGKFSDGWPSSSVLIKKSIPTPYRFATEIENVENLEEESNTCNTTDNKLEKKELVSYEMKHRFHVIDKNSQTLFFVSKTAQVSLYPRSLIQSRSMEVSVGSETIDCIRLILPVYGWVTLKVDFGLEREFKWKFAVVDTIWPIIGIDFLKNFGLQIDYSMEYPRLLDPKTNLKTSEFAGSYNCKFSLDFPFLTALRNLDSDLERFPVQEKLEIINIGPCLNSQCLRKNRMIAVEKETDMPYLFCKSAVSIFPKSRVKDEEIEPFEDSFDIVNIFGSVVPIYGWITRKLDFGLGRYFIWKFPVLNICAPIIANDFLNHYGLTFLESWSIFDCVTAKTIMSSDGWCECQGFDWSDPPDMKKRPKLKIDKPSSDLLEMNESSKESSTL